MYLNRKQVAELGPIDFRLELNEVRRSAKVIESYRQVNGWVTALVLISCYLLAGFITGS